MKPRSLAELLWVRVLAVLTATLWVADKSKAEAPTYSNGGAILADAHSSGLLLPDYTLVLLVAVTAVLLGLLIRRAV